MYTHMLKLKNIWTLMAVQITLHFKQKNHLLEAFGLASFFLSQQALRN